uniref:LysM domain-containing protein n=1 Tax=Tetradesmus obliquus TaxID=3088 RepID=A0A383VXT3_TETOB|eukprot:jgi/Sobl393_1/6038/SZX69632.1
MGYCPHRSPLKARYCWILCCLFAGLTLFTCVEGQGLCATAASPEQSDISAGRDAYRQILFATSPTSYSSVNTSQTGGVRLIQAEPGKQEFCTTCTAFAVVAAAQAAAASVLQRDVQQLLLSVQDLFFCGASRRSCESGWNFEAALQELERRKLLRSDCMPYAVSYKVDFATRACVSKCDDFNPLISKGSFVRVPVGDDWDAQRAIRESGAIVTSFDILDDFKAFSNKSGNAKAVYAPAKGAELSEMHAVAIVGYHGAGTADGYWICLNSWGKDWADGGLFRVKFGCCGILAEAFAVKWTPNSRGSSIPTMPLKPAQGRPGCFLYQARQGDYLSGIAYRAGIDIEQLLLDNVERLDRLDAPLAAKQQLLICNPKLYTARDSGGDKCDKCSIPEAAGGCKCNANCDCISGPGKCNKCNLPQKAGGCKWDANCDCLSAAAASLQWDQQPNKAKAAEWAKLLGCHGTSPLVAALWYVDYNNLFIVPIAHAGLLGAIKSFWSLLLAPTAKAADRQWYTLSGHAKQLMAQRAAHLTPTCDFGRPYTDIVSKKGNWTMEDWLHWTETWSVYITKPDSDGTPLLPERAKKMWQHLRAGLLYFLRSEPPEDAAQDAAAAQQQLKEYATLVEQHFPISMCTFNLHVLVCRLAEQEKARGKVAYCTEYWVEWLVQWAKSCVRYRTTKFPELVLVSDILVDTALAVKMAKHPDCKTFDGWVPAYSAGAPSFPFRDDGDAEGTQLQGGGKQLAGTQRDAAVAAVVAYIREWRESLGPAGWWQQQWDGLAYADIRGGEQLQSLAYSRAISRVSYNVLTNYREHRQRPSGRGLVLQEIKYIARVRYFVKVSPPPRDGTNLGAPSHCQPLRLAIADLFEVQKVADAAGILYHSPRYPQQPSHSSYAVGFDQSTMLDKHVMACAGSEAWFMPYKNMSGSGRAD